ncbi:MAG: hypothetical protein F6K09_05070 [Merismopedia sp. SIO2A8]|nr:hypothetical protein [Merismopedia sp. SIO2A8]
MMSPRDIVYAHITTKDGIPLYHQRWLPKHPMAHELTATFNDGQSAYEDDEEGWHQLSFTPNGTGHWWRHRVVLERLVVTAQTSDSQAA